VIYLAGPITATADYTVEQNIASAAAIYEQFVRAGVACVCTHIPSPFDVDYETWMRFDFAIIDACDTVLMLPRWETSSGAVREHEYALARGKRVVYDVGELLRHDR
jgi:hypothetical protein